MTIADIIFIVGGSLAFVCGGLAWLALTRPEPGHRYEWVRYIPPDAIETERLN